MNVGSPPWVGGNVTSSWLRASSPQPSLQEPSWLRASSPRPSLQEPSWLALIVTPLRVVHSHHASAHGQAARTTHSVSLVRARP